MSHFEEQVLKTMEGAHKRRAASQTRGLGNQPATDIAAVLRKITSDHGPKPSWTGTATNYAYSRHAIL